MNIKKTFFSETVLIAWICDHFLKKNYFTTLG